LARANEQMKKDAFFLKHYGSEGYDL
jgi:hypothetical protein